MKRTFYFNTGVTPANNPNLWGRQVWKGGTKQIPFTCEDVPENAIFKFACSNPNLPESKSENFLVRKILDCGEDGMMSEYAYFLVWNK